MSRITYKSGGYSHVGMVRQINEDAFLELAQDGLWAVADGMGGHAAGDYVSSLIVDSLRQMPVSADLDVFTGGLRERMAQVNRAVRQEARNREVSMMGSTLVLLAAQQDKGVCLWAGDSRLYRLRNGMLKSISRDHSYVQDLQDSGLLTEAQARVHPRGNIVTRAIGVEERIELAEVQLQIASGDTFLLCSDGLNKTTEDHEIRDVLSHRDPYQVVRSLIHLGLTRGAPDNITAIVVKAI
jgi:serine/threonine-protein phosphatase Stp1